MENKIYDIIECRFVDNKYDVVFRILQYGISEKDIEDFWKKYFPNKDKDPYTFIDCTTRKRNVVVKEDDLVKDWSKKLGLKINENNG